MICTKEMIKNLSPEDKKKLANSMVVPKRGGSLDYLRCHHKCDRCSNWKPAPKNSYFTDQMWYCDDCKYEQAKERGMPEVSAVVELWTENKE